MPAFLHPVTNNEFLGSIGFAEAARADDEHPRAMVGQHSTIVVIVVLIKHGNVTHSTIISPLLEVRRRTDAIPDVQQAVGCIIARPIWAERGRGEDIIIQLRKG